MGDVYEEKASPDGEYNEAEVKLGRIQVLLSEYFEEFENYVPEGGLVNATQDEAFTAIDFLLMALEKLTTVAFGTLTVVEIPSDEDFDNFLQEALDEDQNKE